MPKQLRLLFDEDVARLPDATSLDVRYIKDETPGQKDPVVLNRAIKLRRTLVTHDQGYLKAGAVKRTNRGVVVVIPGRLSGADLQDNLETFQFCLLRCLGEAPDNRVFLLKAYEGVEIKRSDGFRSPMMPWTDQCKVWRRPNDQLGT